MNILLPKRFSSFVVGRRAATALETALVLPVFLLLLIGIMEFCLIFMSLNAIEFSASTLSNSLRNIKEQGDYKESDLEGIIRTEISKNSYGLVSSDSDDIDVFLYYLSPRSNAVFVPEDCSGIASGDTCSGTYTDTNENKKFDGVFVPYQSGGKPGDVLQVTIGFTWNILNPLLLPFFPEGKVNFNSYFFLKNES